MIRGGWRHSSRWSSGCMREGRLLAYHDIGDGGLFATLAEMAFASRCGLDVTLDAAPDACLAALFAEELGAVVQVKAERRS